MIPDKELEEMQARAEAAFKPPWTYDDWEVECQAEDHCGDYHTSLTIETPDEYPAEPDNAQVVAQITQKVCDVPGLEDFARANGEFIAHARSDVPRLIAEVKALRATLAVSEAERESSAGILGALVALPIGAENFSELEGCVKGLVAEVKRLREALRKEVELHGGDWTCVGGPPEGLTDLLGTALADPMEEPKP